MYSLWSVCCASGPPISSLVGSADTAFLDVHRVTIHMSDHSLSAAGDPGDDFWSVGLFVPDV